MMFKRMVISLSVFLVVVSSVRALEYEIDVIPDSAWPTNTSLNDNGQVVGYSVRDRTAFYWDSNAGSMALELMLGISPENLSPIDINNNGEILFSHDHKSGLWSMSEGMICEDLSFNGAAINDNGVVAGINHDGYLVRWDRENGLQDIGSTDRTVWFVGDINNNGQIVGAMDGAGGSDEEREIHRAFSYDDGRGLVELDIDLEFPASKYHRSSAFVINNNSHIVGSTESATGWRVVSWDSELNISAISGVKGESEGIRDINDMGEMLYNEGDASYISFNGKDWDNINDYLNDPLLEVIYELQEINNNGQILAYGMYDGQVSSILLTPVPEPGTMIMLGLGMMAIMKRTKI